MHFMIVPQLLGKTQSQLAWLDQQKIFLSDNFLIFKFLFNELHSFNRGLARQNDRDFSSLQSWYETPHNFSYILAVYH